MNKAERDATIMSNINSWPYPEFSKEVFKSVAKYLESNMEPVDENASDIDDFNSDCSALMEITFEALGVVYDSPHLYADALEVIHELFGPWIGEEKQDEPF